MKRIIDHFLMQWKSDSLRQPLLLRGARQVGKTYAVRQLGKTFDNFVEINLETNEQARDIIAKNLDVHRIQRDLTAALHKQIIPGKTLLFIDEVQAVPNAITALRYFYEHLPDLHVIAAGSLIDFAVEQVGIPVGRVSFFYMHPTTFLEFLIAKGFTQLVFQIMHHPTTEPFSEVLHTMTLTLLAEYLAIGGMPKAVQHWVDEQQPLATAKIHARLLGSYRQDFEKYARTKQVKYVELIFDQIPQQMGRKFKYSLIEGDYRKRELAPALDLLVKAGIAHKVYYSAGQGMPLGAQVDPLDYKTLFLDVGLAQTALGLDTAGWLLHPEQEFVNKGSLVEAFVGQELIAYGPAHDKQKTFYWHKETGPRNAEIDYLVQINRQIIPIEVKAGTGSTLRSIHHFLETHPTSPFGIRFSAQNYSVHEKIHSYPLYAIASLLATSNNELHKAIAWLCEQ